MDEIWKPVPEFEKFYEVSDHGRIRRLACNFKDTEGKTYRRPEHFCKPSFTKGPRKGYLWITLQKMGKKTRKDFPVHKLVSACFLPPKPFEKAEINHVDYNKLNNCSINLEWVSHGDNMRHAFKHNQRMRDVAQSFGNRTREINRKLSVDQVKEIRQLFASLKDNEIAQRYNVCRETIGHIRRGKTWLNMAHPD